MPALRMNAPHVGAEAGPDVGQQIVLPQEFRALVAADPAGDRASFHRPEQSGAFGRCFGLVHPQGRVHLGAQQRAQVVDAADRDDVRDAAAEVVRQG